METFVQTKEATQAFLAAALAEFQVIAPLKSDVVRFTPLTKEDLDKIHFQKNAYFPLKEYFFKPRDIILNFTPEKFVQPKQAEPKRIFFGVRKCDLNAVHHQDMVFIDDAHDPYYEAARKNSYLLGYHCEHAPSQYCFCGTLNLIDYFDLMFYDKGTHFLVEVGSPKGDFLVSKYKEFFEHSPRLVTQEERKIHGADRLMNKDMSKLYDHPDWKKGVNNCLSCGACTALCPTCYCFDIHDEVKTSNPKNGERVREWSSCQLPEFSKVAGGHVFRDDREQRFKHRIYHQLEYFKKKYDIPLCVGCGRCIEGCPTRIDFVQIINEMK